MAALNQTETENLSLASRAMNHAVIRLRNASVEGSKTVLDTAEVAFMIDSLTKAEKVVRTVKQMKGYYPS